MRVPAGRLAVLIFCAVVAGVYFRLFAFGLIAHGGVVGGLAFDVAGAFAEFAESGSGAVEEEGVAGLGDDVAAGGSDVGLAGAFDSQDEAFAARRALERRWRARLRRLGGAFRREWPDAWIVGVPEGVEVDGLPWVPEPTEQAPWRDPLGLRGGPWKIW